MSARFVVFLAFVAIGCSGEVVLQDGPGQAAITSPKAASAAACDGTSIGPPAVCPLVPTDGTFASSLAIAAQARTILSGARDRMIVRCNEFADALGVARAAPTAEPSATRACEPVRVALAARVGGHVVEPARVSTVSCAETPLASCGAPVSDARPPTVGCPDVPVSLDVPPGYEADAAILTARLPGLESAYQDAASAIVLYTDVASRIGSPPHALPSGELECAVGLVMSLNAVVVHTNEDANAAMLGIWKTLGR